MSVTLANLTSRVETLNRDHQQGLSIAQDANLVRLEAPSGPFRFSPYMTTQQLSVYLERIETIFARVTEINRKAQQARNFAHFIHGESRLSA